MKRYFRNVRAAHAEVKRAEEWLMESTNEQEMEERNAAAWDAVERRRDAIFGDRWRRGRA